MQGVSRNTRGGVRTGPDAENRERRRKNPIDRVYKTVPESPLPEGEAMRSRKQAYDEAAGVVSKRGWYEKENNEAV